MNDPSILITGANGQLGLALKAKYPDAKAVSREELDISNEQAVSSYDYSGIKTIINAAAYTNVDGAETPEGSEQAQKVNDKAVGYLARVAKEKGLVLVHISTDYVFDGTKKIHTEDEIPNPLGVYAKSKSAGDEKAMTAPKYYVLRASWVIGDGKNFVHTMLDLGKKGINPGVVSDQIGRLTFTGELVQAIDHLLTAKAPYGIYNLSNDGEPASWAEITREIFRDAGLSNAVTDVTTAEYFKDKPGASPRPLNSTLDLAKIKATGFTPKDWKVDLNDYIKKEQDK